MHAPVRRYGRRRTSGAEPGIACDRGLRMTRHFDFRDDGHEPLCRIGDDAADFILGIETAVDGAGGGPRPPESAMRRPG